MTAAGEIARNHRDNGLLEATSQSVALKDKGGATLGGAKVRIRK